MILPNVAVTISFPIKIELLDMLVESNGSKVPRSFSPAPKSVAIGTIPSTIPEVDLYYDTTSQRALTAISTVQTMFSNYQNSYLASYLEANNLSSKILQPFTYNEHAKDEEADSMSLMMLGMLIPMMIIGYIKITYNTANKTINSIL